MASIFDTLSWIIRGRYKATPIALADGEAGELQVDSAGALLVRLLGGPRIAGYHDTVVPAAGATVRTGAGSLVYAHGFNSGSSTVYLQFHEATAEPSAGATPKIVLPLPAGQPFSLQYDTPRPFVTGIRWQLSSTIGTYTAVAGTAVVQAGYQ